MGKPDTYELTETILLDSTGAWSSISVLVRATGHQAEALRNQLADMGMLEMAKGRLQHYAQRFVKASRIGQIELRDDRPNNELFLAEAFEIQGFTGETDKQKRLVFSLQSNIIVFLLAMPDSIARRTPFALPYPCELVHVINIETSTMKHARLDRNEVKSPFFHFQQTVEEGWGRWSMNLKFSSLAEAVPADRVQEHRDKVAQVRHLASKILLIPPGHMPPVRRKEFGVLPSPSRQRSNQSAAEPPGPAVGVSQTAHSPDANDAQSADASHEAQKRFSVEPTPLTTASAPVSTGYYEEMAEQHRRRHRSRLRQRQLVGRITMIAFVIILLILFALIFKR